MSGISKVVFGNQTVLDLTSDTVSASTLLRGYTAHTADGTPISGTYDPQGSGTLIQKTIRHNGTYLPSYDNADGYSQVTVNVSPNVGRKVIEENGTYSASTDNYDGYSQVVVDVEAEFPEVIKPTVTVGTYEYDGTPQGPEIVWEDDMDIYCEVTNATAIAAGTYTLVISLKIPELMEWDDHTTADLTYTYTIDPAFPVYGVEWDGTSSVTWTRTDKAANFTNPIPYREYNDPDGNTDYGSPFDTIMPWAGMVITTIGGHTVVAIPKFWYKLQYLYPPVSGSSEGTGLKIQISNQEIVDDPDFVVSPAHCDRGDGVGERDVVYVGRFPCRSSDYYSAAGSPMGRQSRASARAAIHNIGSDVWQMDFLTEFTLWLLYLVEYADWRSQNMGRGGAKRDSWSVVVQSNGYTNNMPYHSGDCRYNRNEGYTGMQYRNIEGLWSNVNTYYDGCREDTTTGHFFIIPNPADFSDTANGVDIYDVNTISGAFVGLPTKFKILSGNGIPPIFLPSNIMGVGTGRYHNYGYTNDEMNFKWNNAFGEVFHTSVDDYYNDACGMFNLINLQSSYTPGSLDYGAYSCRLMILPSS